MPGYKLTYFNSRGRAEIIRLIFAVAGVEYEDVRIEKDQWPALKPHMPFGQLPVLEFDGKKFCQSNAIARYLARKFKLNGKTDVEDLQVDMIIDCMEDTFKPLINFWGEKDEIRKAAMKKKFAEEELPASYASLESLLKTNNGGDGFFVGRDLTWADLTFLSLASWGKVSGNEALLNNYPKLKALEKRVTNVPQVAAWIAKRPVTDF